MLASTVALGSMPIAILPCCCTHRSRIHLEVEDSVGTIVIKRDHVQFGQFVVNMQGSVGH